MMIPSQSIADGIVQVTLWAIPLIVSITMHEAAHGLAALKMGDDTALRMGRISANPLRHVDPVGTILLPGLLLLQGGHVMFGWAKPVPVNFSRLRPPRIGMILVALAGPLSNLVMALIACLLCYLLPLITGPLHEWARGNFVNAIQINLVLCVFNMIPLPPLDGGRVLVGILPSGLGRGLAGLERYTMIILMVAMLALPVIGINVFGWLVGIPTEFLAGILFRLTGLS